MPTPVGGGILGQLVGPLPKDGQVEPDRAHERRDEQATESPSSSWVRWIRAFTRVRDRLGAHGSESKRPKTPWRASSSAAGVSHAWLVEAFPARV